MKPAATGPGPPLRAPALLADLGGTNARFALRTAEGGIELPTHEATAGSADLATVLAERLSFYESLSSFVPREAALAVAGPVTGDRVELTNASWSFSIESLRAELELDRLEVVNDLAALALALRELEGKDVETFIEGKDGGFDVDLPRAVVSVGTGLGVGGLVPHGRPGRGSRSGASPSQSVVSSLSSLTERLGFAVLSSEGGHRDLAASTEREWRVIARLSARYGGRASAERALSGAGLAALWRALAELDGESGEPDPDLDPAEVSHRASAREPRATEAVALFSGWLGAFCGDLALTLGARGGVYLAGGVLEGLGPTFDSALFTERFLAKGRFRAWLADIPVRRILDPHAAFRGLARLLDS